MDEQELKIITRYIAAWGWELNSIILLCLSIIASMLNKIPYIMGSVIAMAYCLFMSLKRQREING
jgi:hypothetical protein